jgi:hypothetical protein
MCAVALLVHSAFFSPCGYVLRGCCRVFGSSFCVNYTHKMANLLNPELVSCKPHYYSIPLILNSDVPRDRGSTVPLYLHPMPKLTLRAMPRLLYAFVVSVWCLWTRRDSPFTLIMLFYQSTLQIKVHNNCFICLCNRKTKINTKLICLICDI